MPNFFGVIISYYSEEIMVGVLSKDELDFKYVSLNLDKFAWKAIGLVSILKDTMPPALVKLGWLLSVRMRCFLICPSLFWQNLFDNQFLAGLEVLVSA